MSCFFKRSNKHYNQKYFSKIFRSVKPNQIWVDKSGEFYNRSLKSWLQDNDVKMYSTYNQGKSVIVGRIVRTLNNKTYKYLILISKNAYIDKLHDIVNEYINTYHSTVE